MTTKLAKLCVTDKPKCQQYLQYASTSEIVTKQNHQFYQNTWKVTSMQLLCLYQKYCNEYPDLPVSKGLFFNLKPFYVCNASKKNMDMCLCKLHLHTQWSIESLLKRTKQVNVELDATNFQDFLGILMINCPPEQNTHVVGLHTK